MIYLAVFAMMTVLIYLFGARSQNKRYRARQRQFNKVLKYFNAKYFNKKGINIKSGKFGAYLIIGVWDDHRSTLGFKKKSSREQRNALENGVINPQHVDIEADPGVRRSEFSKSLIMELDQTSLLDEKGKPVKKINLLDHFMDGIDQDDPEDRANVALKLKELIGANDDDEDEDLWDYEGKNNLRGQLQSAELINEARERISLQHPMTRPSDSARGSMLGEQDALKNESGTPSPVRDSRNQKSPSNKFNFIGNNGNSPSRNSGGGGGLKNRLADGLKMSPTRDELKRPLMTDEDLDDQEMRTVQEAKDNNRSRLSSASGLKRKSSGNDPFEDAEMKTAKEVKDTQRSSIISKALRSLGIGSEEKKQSQATDEKKSQKSSEGTSQREKSVSDDFDEADLRSAKEFKDNFSARLSMLGTKDQLLQLAAPPKKLAGDLAALNYSTTLVQSQIINDNIESPNAHVNGESRNSEIKTNKDVMLVGSQISKHESSLQNNDEAAQLLKSDTQQSQVKTESEKSSNREVMEEKSKDSSVASSKKIDTQFDGFIPDLDFEKSVQRSNFIDQPIAQEKAKSTNRSHLDPKAASSTRMTNSENTTTIFMDKDAPPAAQVEDKSSMGGDDLDEMEFMSAVELNTVENHSRASFMHKK